MALPARSALRLLAALRWPALLGRIIIGWTARKNRTNVPARFLFVLSLAALLPSPVLAGIVVVGAQHLEIDALSESDVQRLFSGRKRAVGGVELTPLDLPSDATVREDFYREALDQSLPQMRAHWARMTFSGKDTPPKIVSDVQQLDILIQSHRSNYICYVDEKDVTSNMKILFRVGR